MAAEWSGSCSSSAHSGAKQTSCSCGYCESQERSCATAATGVATRRVQRWRVWCGPVGAHRPSVHHALLDLDDGRSARARVPHRHRPIARRRHERVPAKCGKCQMRKVPNLRYGEGASTAPGRARGGHREGEGGRGFCSRRGVLDGAPRAVGVSLPEGARQHLTPHSRRVNTCRVVRAGARHERRAGGRTESRMPRKTLVT